LNPIARFTKERFHALEEFVPHVRRHSPSDRLGLAGHLGMKLAN
jgi:hypothetical protein